MMTPEEYLHARLRWLGDRFTRVEVRRRDGWTEDLYTVRALRQLSERFEREKAAIASIEAIFPTGRSERLYPLGADAP